MGLEGMTCWSRGKQMAVTDPTQQATKLAADAIGAMASRGIAPTPSNYLIWYSHCSGCHPELSRQLKVVEAKGEGFSDDCLAAIHDRYFGTGGQVRLLDETCQRIEATMGHLLQQVEGMSGDAGSYGEKLESFTSELTPTRSVHELRPLVEGILAETREMQSRSTRLEDELTDSSKRIEDLRSDLAEAQREANTDGLTGIPNRKHFDRELAASAETSMDSGEPMCLLLADIDHFKQFNDTYGHQVGDQVLRLVAQVLTKTVKGRDLAARYGGEEFGVVLPQTDLEGARKLAEQIRLTVANNRIRLKSSRQDLGTITLSVGCAQYLPGESLVELIERADAGLYQAKREGRNRVVAIPFGDAGAVAAAPAA
jgi:diguanylate cyclase